jgi:hypothetical protein
VTDNRRNVRVLEYNVEDAPAILHALSVGATTAMMCGHPNAQRALELYKDAVRQNCPKHHRLFTIGEVWTDIALAIMEAKEFEIWLDGYKPWRDGEVGKGRINVRVGGVNWPTDCWDEVTADDERVTSTLEWLQNIAPMDCVGRIDPIPKKPEEGTYRSGKR